METVTVTLGERKFTLPREYIQTALPGSLLASALEVDPDATEIPLSHPDVTPAALAVLERLSQGIEPETHEPTLLLASQYLGIPALLFYYDPLYDLIPHRHLPNHDANKPILKRIIQEDHAWLYGYLMRKGLHVKPDHLREAIAAGAVNTARLILQSKANQKGAFRHLLAVAIQSVQPGSLRLLLSDPTDDRIGFDFAKIETFSPSTPERFGKLVDIILGDERFTMGTHADLIAEALRRGYVEALQKLLQKNIPLDWYLGGLVINEVVKLGNIQMLEAVWPYLPKKSHRELYAAALHADKVDLVTHLLTKVRPNPSDLIHAKSADMADVLLRDPRIVPSSYNNQALTQAALHGRADVVQRLLRDPRVDPTDQKGIALKLAIRSGDLETVRLLLPLIDPMEGRNNALLEAATLRYTGDQEFSPILELLLADPRVDPGANKSAPLRAAVENSSVDGGQLKNIRRLLADPRVDPTVNNNALIKRLAYLRDNEVAALLLAHPKVQATYRPRGN